MREEIEKVVVFLTENRETLFHGTSSPSARRILSQGFIPNPKNKVWTDEEESYYGSYFSTSVETAIDYGETASYKYGNPFKVVVFCVQVETRTALPDEDNLPHLKGAFLNSVRKVVGPSRESFLHAKDDGFDDDIKRDCVNTLLGALKISGKKSEFIWNRLYEVVSDLYDLIEKFGSTIINRKEYRSLVDEYARIVKDVIGTQWSHLSKGARKRTLRVPSSISFRGANKITGAVELFTDKNPVEVRIIFGDVDQDTLSRIRSYFLGRISSRQIEVTRGYLE